MGAVDDSEAIFDREFLELRIYVPFATGALEDSGCGASRSRCGWLIGLGGRCPPEGAGPPADGFVVNLGESDFGSFERSRGVSFRGVVPGVDFKEVLEFLGRGGRSLPEQGLFDRLVAEVIVAGVDDPSDSSRVNVDA